MQIDDEIRKKNVKRFSPPLPFFQARKLEAILYDKYYGEGSNLIMGIESIYDEQEEDVRIRKMIQCARSKYASIVRRLSFNLRNQKNTRLLQEVKEKKIPLTQLIKMDGRDLWPEHWAAYAKKQYEEMQRMKEKKKERTAEESMFQCGRCKSHDVTFTQLQTRSGGMFIVYFVTN